MNISWMLLLNGQSWKLFLWKSTSTILVMDKYKVEEEYTKLKKRKTHYNTSTHGPFLWNRQRQQGRILRWSGARPAVPLFFQTAPPWWSLLLLHSNISFLLRTCSHILPSFLEGMWEKDVTYLHLPLEDIGRKDWIYFFVVINIIYEKPHYIF